MPNWCENNLTVRGPLTEIKRFFDGIKKTLDKDGDEHHAILEGLYPIPEEVSERDWCIENWGTKWGDCYTELQKKDAENLLYYFESAWGPPIEGFDKIAKDFPQLVFYLTYEEPGMCFEGYAKWANGVSVDSLSQDRVRFEISEFGQEWREEKEPVRYD